MANVRARKGWASRGPIEDIAEIDDGDITYAEGHGTVSGAGVAALWKVLPVNGFGNCRFTIRIGNTDLLYCRVTELALPAQCAFSYQLADIPGPLPLTIENLRSARQA